MTPEPVDVVDDLDEHLARPGLVAVEHGAQIDEHRANALIRAVAWKRRRLADAEAQARAEQERIHEWIVEQRRRWSVAELERTLQQYHEARLADDASAKTLRLPAGELRSRATGPSWQFDPVVFVPWAEEHAPEVLRTKVEVDKAAAKAALGHRVLVDGEEVPGVSCSAPARAFAVVTDEGGF